MMENKDLYEINALDTIYHYLRNDEKLLTMIDKDSIFKFNIPEEHREQPPVVRITGYQSPTHYGDGLQLGWYCTIQIDAWSEDDPFEIGMQINKIMSQLNFGHTSSAPEYDEDTYLIRNGKRYEGTIIADLSKLATE